MKGEVVRRALVTALLQSVGGQGSRTKVEHAPPVLPRVVMRPFRFPRFASSETAEAKVTGSARDVRGASLELPFVDLP